MRTRVLLAAGVFFAHGFVAFAAEPLRSARIIIDGTVANVTTVSVARFSLTAESITSNVYLDIEIVAAAHEESGQAVRQSVVRLNCTDAHIAECRGLRKGDAVHAAARFSGIRSGFEAPTGLDLVSLRPQ